MQPPPSSGLEYDPERDIYAASLLDSRGWVAVNCAYRTNPRTGTLSIQHWLLVTVKCSRAPVIAWLKSSYRSGSVHSGKWQVTNGAARDFLLAVAGHLRLRRGQAALAIVFQNHMDTERYKHLSGAPGDRNAEVEWREDMRRRIAALGL